MGVCCGFTLILHSRSGSWFVFLTALLVGGQGSVIQFAVSEH